MCKRNTSNRWYILVTGTDQETFDDGALDLTGIDDDELDKVCWGVLKPWKLHVNPR